MRSFFGIAVGIAVCVALPCTAYHVAEFGGEPMTSELFADGTRRFVHHAHGISKTGKRVDFDMESFLDTKLFEMISFHDQPDVGLRIVDVDLTGAVTQHRIALSTTTSRAAELTNTLRSDKVGKTVVIVGRSSQGVPILHRVDEVEVSPNHNGTRLLLMTKPMRVNEVFRHAHATLRSDYLPNRFVPLSKPKVLSRFSGTPAERLGWSWNPISDIVQAAHIVTSTVSNVVSDVVTPIYDGIEAITTGSLSKSGSEVIFDDSFTVSGSTSGSTSSGGKETITRAALTADGVTVTGEAMFDLGIHLNIDIQDYVVNNITTYFYGSVFAAINGTFESSTNYSYQEDDVVGTFTFDPIELDIGIPIQIQPSIPLHLGVVIDLFGEISVTCGANATGQVRNGFTYTPNGFQPISEKELSYELSKPVISAAVDASVSLYVMPVLTTNIDYFGGPYLSLKASAEGMVKAYVDSNGNDQFTLDVDLVLLSTVGGVVGINSTVYHFTENFGPATIFNENIPLLSFNTAEGASSSSSSASTSYGASSSGAGRILSRLGKSKDCPIPPGGLPPTSSDIGQSLRGVMSLESGNSLGLQSAIVTMQATFIEGQAGSAVNITFACTLSASYANADNTLQYFSQQAYCYLWDVGEDDEIAFSLSSDATITFANGTEVSSMPNFGFNFVGTTGGSCNVDVFILKSPGIGQISISGV